MDGGLSKVTTADTVEGTETSWWEEKKSPKYLALCKQ